MMVAVRPLRKSRVVKKRTKKFIRHQSDRYVKLKVNILMNLADNDYLFRTDFMAVKFFTCLPSGTAGAFACVIHTVKAVVA